MWYDALNTGATYHVRSKPLMWSTRIKLYRARTLDRAAWRLALGHDVTYAPDWLTLEVSQNGSGWDIKLSRVPQIAGKYDSAGKLVPTPEPPEVDIEQLWEMSEKAVQAMVKAEMKRTGYANLTLDDLGL